MIPVTKQAPMTAQHFIDKLKVCFPDINHRQPFGTKQECYSQVIGQDFTLFSSSFWHIKGSVSDINGGSEYRLEPVFSWSKVAANTGKLSLVTLALAVGVFLSHTVPPAQYGALSVAERVVVDLWCSWGSFLAIFLTAPIYYLLYCFSLSQKSCDLVATILQKLSATVPEGLIGQSISTLTDRQASLICNTTPVEFLQCLALELRALDEASESQFNFPVYHKLSTPSPDSFDVTHHIKQQQIRYLAEYLSEGSTLKIYIKEAGAVPLWSTNSALKLWALGCVLILAVSGPTAILRELSFFLIVGSVSLVAALLPNLLALPGYYNSQFTDLLKRAASQLPDSAVET